MSRTYIANATANWGCISSTNASYATTAQGSSLSLLTGTPGEVGQQYEPGQPLYAAYEVFTEFDFTALPSGAVLSEMVLSIYVPNYTNPDNDQWGMQPYDWGATLGVGNWRTPAEIKALPGFAAWGFWGNGNEPVAGAYNSSQIGGNDFAMLNYLDAGKLRLLWASVNFQNGIPPGSQSWMQFDGYGQSNPPYVTVTYNFPAPTITAIEPAVSQLAGGATATIVGTGFQNNDPGAVSVTICGIAATDVVAQTDTQLTCTVPASASAQLGSVVVSTANNGSGTLTDAFTYVNTVDSHVYLMKGGAIVGTDHASSTIWPLGATAASYGGSGDTWGESWLPSDVNGAGFGVALAADVGAGHANVEGVEVTVYYTTPGGASLPGTYLVALSVDPTGETVTPLIYKLPYSGFPPSMDQSIPHAISGADFFTSRMYLPNRNVEKSYRCVEFYADLSPSVNTPGMQVWAAVDDGAFFQLVDGDGNPLTVTASGAQRAFFPVTTVGHFLQLDLKVPALGAGQVPVGVTVRDLLVRLSLRPVASEAMTATLVLGPGQFVDGTSMLNTTQSQRALLEALFVPGATVAYRDPVTGIAGQALATAMEFQELVFPGKDEPTLVAHISMRKAVYQ